MAFSILMGTSRLIYGKYGDRFDLDQFMKLSTLLCIGSYLLIAFGAGSGGPTLVGFVSSAFSNNLRVGIGASILFPVLLLAGLVLVSSKRNEKCQIIF